MKIGTTTTLHLVQLYNLIDSGMALTIATHGLINFENPLDPSRLDEIVTIRGEIMTIR